MKRLGGRPSGIVPVAVALCILAGVGVALQGRFLATGPRWLQGGGSAVAPPHQEPPQNRPLGSVHSRVTHQVADSQATQGALVVSLLLLLAAVLAFLLWRWIRARRERDIRGLATPTIAQAIEVDAAGATGPQPDLEVLRRGLDRAGDDLSGTREPRDAIVRAWIGLQEAAEDSGMSRRPSETPTEFTTRVFHTVHADRAAAQTLLELYLRVRFGSQPATGADVETAREAVARLAQTWPSESWSRS